MVGRFQQLYCQLFLCFLTEKVFKMQVIKRVDIKIEVLYIWCVNFVTFAIKNIRFLFICCIFLNKKMMKSKKVRFSLSNFKIFIYRPENSEDRGYRETWIIWTNAFWKQSGKQKSPLIYICGFHESKIIYSRIIFSWTFFLFVLFALKWCKMMM